MVIPSIPLWLAFAIGLPIGILGYFGQAYVVGRRGRRRAEVATAGGVDGAVAARPEPRKAWGPSTATRAAAARSKAPKPKRGTAPKVAETAPGEVAAVLATVADAPAKATPKPGKAAAAPRPPKAAAIKPVPVAAAKSEAAPPAPAPPTPEPPAPAPAPPRAMPDIAPAKLRSARYGKTGPQPAAKSAGPSPSAEEIVPVGKAALSERRQRTAALTQLRRREAVLEDALDVIVGFVDAEPRRAKASMCAKSLDAIMPRARRPATLRAFLADAVTAKSPSDLQDQAEELGIEFATELKEVKTQLISIPG
ncbi:MAG TPA: hypothetical protein VG329_08670 [Candidatus Dormibacteraeota bacterium]|nr:hypothetical protein [Candidatus Dormibacteraeota bacterium]